MKGGFETRPYRRFLDQATGNTVHVAVIVLRTRPLYECGTIRRGKYKARHAVPLRISGHECALLERGAL
jgi:hypothetical protein